jgi:uncharacterized membrane protein YcaP (DUF421 family)
MTAETLLGVGQDPHNYTVLQVCMRTLVIFFTALFMIRVADHRFLAQKTGFDAVVALILASTLSRAINGPAGLSATIACGFLIVAIHRVLSKLAFHSSAFCHLIKGQSHKLIEDGRVIDAAMRRHDLTEADLHEDMRLQGVREDFSKVREARIERSGEISVIVNGKD